MVISSTIGRRPAMAAPMPAPMMPDFGDRRVQHALFAELLEQALGHGVGAAVRADVLAHEEDAVVAEHLFAQRLAQRVAHAHLSHRRAPWYVVAEACSRPGCGLASANSTAASTVRSTRSAISREARLVEHACADMCAFSASIGVALAVAFDLVLQAIELRVRHRVAAVAVGHRFDEVRAAACAGVGRSALRRLAIDLEDVHAVDLTAGML